MHPRTLPALPLAGILLLSSLALAGCFDTTPTTTTSPGTNAAEAGKVTAPEWKQGATWVYQATTPDGGRFVRTQVRSDNAPCPGTAERCLELVTAEAATENGPYAETRTEHYQKGTFQMYVGATPTVGVLRFPLAKGDTWLAGTLSCTALAPTTVTVPAGTYAVHPIRCGEFAGGPQVTTYSYAPQVGYFVKTTREAAGTVLETLELRSTTVTAAPNGPSLPTAATATATATATPPSPTPPPTPSTTTPSPTPVPVPPSGPTMAVPTFEQGAYWEYGVVYEGMTGTARREIVDTEVPCGRFTCYNLSTTITLGDHHEEAHDLHDIATLGEVRNGVRVEGYRWPLYGGLSWTTTSHEGETRRCEVQAVTTLTVKGVRYTDVFPVRCVHVSGPAELPPVTIDYLNAAVGSLIERRTGENVPLLALTGHGVRPPAPTPTGPVVRAPAWTVGDQWEYRILDGEGVVLGRAGWYVIADDAACESVDEITCYEVVNYAADASEGTVTELSRQHFGRETLAGFDLQFPFQSGSSWSTSTADCAVEGNGDGTYVIHCVTGDGSVLYQYDPLAGFFTRFVAFDAGGETLFDYVLDTPSLDQETYLRAFGELEEEEVVVGPKGAQVKWDATYDAATDLWSVRFLVTNHDATPLEGVTLSATISALDSTLDPPSHTVDNLATVTIPARSTTLYSMKVLHPVAKATAYVTIAVAAYGPSPFPGLNESRSTVYYEPFDKKVYGLEALTLPAGTRTETLAPQGAWLKWTVTYDPATSLWKFAAVVHNYGATPLTGLTLYATVASRDPYTTTAEEENEVALSVPAGSVKRYTLQVASPVSEGKYVDAYVTIEDDEGNLYLEETRELVYYYGGTTYNSGA